MDFAPDALRFVSQVGTSEPIRLSRYEDPTRPRRLYYLWRDGCRATVDPVWARFVMLKELERNVLSYEPATCRLVVPYYLPLPPLVERALCLCSGFAPGTSKGRLQGAATEALEAKVYCGIPGDVASAVASRLGQQLLSL